MSTTYNILLAEDSQEDAHLTLIAFQNTGIAHQVEVVPDGETCVNYLVNNFNTRNRPDLILLDLNMPRKDGKSVLREIKKDLKLSSIPTIVLSTSQSQEDILACYELKADCVLAKPLGFREFSKLINSVASFWLKRPQVSE